MSSSSLSSRRLALLSGFVLLGVVGAASVCSADSAWRRRSVAAPATPYRVSLESLDGRALPTFQHGSTSYVLGVAGEAYNVRVSNPTAERVEVVVTVDGRDSVSGRVGDYVSQRGYLVDPWGSLLVEGFRRNLDEVAAFRFAERRRSYSARRGTPEYVGVIGVAVFPEKLRAKPLWRPPRPSHEVQSAPHSGAGRAEKGAPVRSEPSRAEYAPRDRYRDDVSDTSPPRPRAREARPSHIGTEYGEDRDSSVVEVAFERRSPTHPVAVLTLRYDDYEGLRARGIDLSALDVPALEREPEPFPYSRFAPPPPR